MDVQKDSERQRTERESAREIVGANTKKGGARARSKGNIFGREAKR